MEINTGNQVVRRVFNGAVIVQARRFSHEVLLNRQWERVLVAWDETDGGMQVWVGDMDGQLICSAQANPFDKYLPEPLFSEQVKQTRQAMLQVLWAAGGQLSALELFTRTMEKVGDNQYPEQMCLAVGFKLDDTVSLTATGIQVV